MFVNLERGSSPVDWCELNYTVSPVIAEFFNTVSNVLFLLIPPVMMSLFQEYSNSVARGINVIWALFMVVGLCSAYFHATLSLFGQLLDELSILWICMATLVMFTPNRYFPKFVGQNRRFLAYYASLFTMLATGFLAMYPAANSFALMGFFIPAGNFLIREMQTCKCHRIYRLTFRSIVVCLAAILSWIIDRFFCNVCLSIDFPYMHSIWHILVFLGTYTTVVIFAYYFAQDESPEQKPHLKYWPINNFEFGIPYVAVKHLIKNTNKDLSI